ncbi:MAG: DedA family protein [Bacteroidia bacterium]|nr:DedA family protein [Bacteroidia bacterium]
MVLLFVVIFAENGVFFGFFLPGDSLLFTAGLLCATGIIHDPVEVVLLVISIASVLGYSFGYYFGHKTGKALLNRPDSMFFKKKHIEVARTYYDKYGGKTLIIGRFLPIVRTFAPILAGIINMDMKRFMLINIIGAVLWPLVVVNAGYFLGKMVPNARDYLSYVIVLMVIVTAIPIVNAYNNKKKSKAQSEESSSG